MTKLKRYIFLSLLTAGAIILSIVEGMIPLPFIAPGAKLGLSNIITLTVIIVFGFKDVILVVILRCILIMFIIGNPISFLFSIVSGIAAVLMMYLSHKYLNKYLSFIGVSVLGAVTHNTFQILVAAIMFESIGIFAYLPVMCLISIFTGFFVGVTCIYIVDNLNKNINKIKRGIIDEEK